MDTKKNVVDVSCFFIFEATGDSEADQFDDPNKATGSTIDRDGDGDGGDFNDAESCSHDEDNFPFVNINNEANGIFYDNAKVCIDDDEEEEEGEEAHSYYPAWPHEPHNNNNNNNNNGQKISNVDSSHEELLSEMEKNKLFWDTCLAS